MNGNGDSLVGKVTVEGGELVIRIPVRLEVFEVMKHLEDRAKECLTPQQYAVFKLVMEKKANKEIADKLNISYWTARFHVSNVLHRLHCESRSDLWQRALE